MSTAGGRRHKGADGLNDGQRLFALYLHEGCSGREAAERAGYRGSAAYLRVHASRTRRVPAVVAELERLAAGGDAAPAADTPAPQAGPQEAFANSPATIAIYGGGAGGGKSWSLLFEPIKWATYVDGRWCLPDGFRAVVFRRTMPELTRGGGLWDESQSMYRHLGARPRTSPTLDWFFKGDKGGEARVELRHLQYEQDVHTHHGAQYTLVGFDEVQTFTEKQFWYLMSRLRSTCGVVPYMRATCNPDPASFVAKLIAWWIGEDGYAIPERSGVLRWLVRHDEVMHWYGDEDAAKAAHPDRRPISVTFILSKLSDNVALTDADPDYQDKLASLARVDRLRLLGEGDRGGNWKARDGGGLVFRRTDFNLDTRPPSPPLYAVRCWDKGATAPGPRNGDPSWTRGVRVWICRDGEWWIDHVASVRDRPAVVDKLMRETAEMDGREVTVGLWQDAAQAGIVDVDSTKKNLSTFALETVRVAEGVIRGYGGRAKWTHAKAWAKHAEDGLVHVLGGQDWTETLVAECNDFPDTRHDDIVDCLSLAWILFEDRIRPPGDLGITTGGRRSQSAALRKRRYA